MMTESNHIRRPLSSLKVMSQIEKIVDPVIRNLVQGNVGKINNKKGLSHWVCLQKKVATVFL